MKRKKKKIKERSWNFIFIFIFILFLFLFKKKIMTDNNDIKGCPYHYDVIKLLNLYFIHNILIIIIIINIIIIIKFQPVPLPSPLPSLIQDALNKVHSYMQQFITQSNIPGGYLSIIYGNDILLSKSYGYADVANKITPNKG